MASPFGTSTSHRRPVSIALMVVALGWLAVSSASAATVTVAAVNFEFKPPSVAVRVGDTVRWTFTGDPHSVRSGVPEAPDGPLDSGIVDPGGSFQFTFDSAGTYRYFCQIHPEQMAGTIVVSAGSNPTPTPRPTAKPTARPTSRPTARPTARPTVRPTASAAATASATASPTTSPATPSPATPTASSVPSPTPTASSSGSNGLGSASASPSVGPDVPGSVASVNPVAILGGLVVLVLLAAGAVLAARRARRA